MLRAIIAWLNKRFPEVLTVTKQDWTDLRQEVASYNQFGAAITELHNRLTVVESQLKRLNESNGFVQQGKASFKLER